MMHRPGSVEYDRVVRTRQGDDLMIVSPQDRARGIGDDFDNRCAHFFDQPGQIAAMRDMLARVVNEPTDPPAVSAPTVALNRKTARDAQVLFKPAQFSMDFAHLPRCIGRGVQPANGVSGSKNTDLAPGAAVALGRNKTNIHDPNPRRARGLPFTELGIGPSAREAQSRAAGGLEVSMWDLTSMSTSLKRLDQAGSHRSGADSKQAICMRMVGG